MTYYLLKSDDPRLHLNAEDCTRGEDVSEIVDAMFSICRQFGGVALAAPQIGVMKNIVIIDIDNLVLINPMVHPIEMRSLHISNTFPLKERCLSLPGIECTIIRSMFVDCIYREYKTWKQKQFYAHGLYAAILQHEQDHLYGKLITDHTAVV